MSGLGTRTGYDLGLEFDKFFAKYEDAKVTGYHSDIRIQVPSTEISRRKLVTPFDLPRKL